MTLERRTGALGFLLTILQLVVVAIVILAPLVWMVLSSFKTSEQVTAYPPELLFHPTLANYVRLARTTSFLRDARNSLIESGGATILGLLLGVPAAYAASISRSNWPALVSLSARMAPGTLFLVPWYIVFRDIGLGGSYAALILTQGVIALPIVIWVLLPAFDSIPRSVLEAAEVDGCGMLRGLWRIALPLVSSGIVIATILAFVFSWNFFLFALVLSDHGTKPLVVAAFNFIGEGSTDWGGLMAAATLITLPPLVLAIAVQRWLVAGLTIGAVKG